jgi:hypothetical protein
MLFRAGPIERRGPDEICILVDNVQDHPALMILAHCVHLIQLLTNLQRDQSTIKVVSFSESMKRANQVLWMCLTEPMYSLSFACQLSAVYFSGH